jgi:hypothetical protein
MSPPAFLQAQGYSQVPLMRNGVGHFETNGMLGLHPVRVLIDTGAASTIVGLSVVEELGLNKSSLGAVGGGAGGARLEVFQLHETELLLGAVRPQPRILLAMDLGHVNEALRLKGSTPVDVILGWTFLRINPQ